MTWEPSRNPLHRLIALGDALAVGFHRFRLDPRPASQNDDKLDEWRVFKRNLIPDYQPECISHLSDQVICMGECDRELVTDARVWIKNIMRIELEAKPPAYSIYWPQCMATFEHQGKILGDWYATREGLFTLAASLGCLPPLEVLNRIRFLRSWELPPAYEELFTWLQPGDVEKEVTGGQEKRLNELWQQLHKTARPILKTIVDSTDRLTAEEIGNKINKSETTVRRYLPVLRKLELIGNEEVIGYSAKDLGKSLITSRKKNGRKVVGKQ